MDMNLNLQDSKDKLVKKNKLKTKLMRLSLEE